MGRYRFFLFFFIFSTTVCAKFDWKELDAQSLSILLDISDEKFTDAFERIEKIKTQVGTFRIDLCYQAAAYYKIMEEYKTREFEGKFNESVEQAIKELEKYKTKNTDLNARRLQYLASVYGYRGMYRSLRYNWDGAFLDGRNAYNILEKSLKLNSTLYDNYAGIGTYLYWRSKKSGFVKYILFWWGDQREKGINYLKLAIEKGSLIKLWALGGLFRVYIEEERWDEALKVVNDLLNISLSDTGSKKRKAFVLEKLGKQQNALDIYENLLSEIENQSFNVSNAKIDLIYNILRLKKSMQKEFNKEIYLTELSKLEHNVTDSFDDIKNIIKQIKNL